MSFVLLAEWEMSEMQRAQLPVASVSRFFAFVSLKPWSCRPPTICCTSILRFSSIFFSLKALWRWLIWTYVSSSVQHYLGWCAEQIQVLSLQSVHLCIVSISLNRKSLLTAVIVHAWAQHFFPLYQRLSWMLSEPRKFPAVMLIGKIKSMVIFCIWRTAMVE